MLLERESVSYSARAEKYSVEEVLVGVITVSETCAGMEIEWNIHTTLYTLLSNPEKFRRKICEWSAHIFLTDDIESSN